MAIGLLRKLPLDPSDSINPAARLKHQKLPEYRNKLMH